MSAICRSVNSHIRNISHIRKYIDQSTCQHVVRALVTSRLDYANSLLFSSSDNDLQRLQLLQNRAASVIFRARKFDHVTPFYLRLHWLRIPQRIKFKVLVMTYKCLQHTAPSYLQDLISIYYPSRCLRSSSDKSTLTVPRTNLANSFGCKCFFAAAPFLWNGLPRELRQAPTLKQFKSALKTHLFQ